MLDVEIAVAKVAKYATHESGDSVEVIERPRGGLSLVIADGQRSGSSAKAISNIAVRKAVSLLGEGVRDGAVARAAHDYLRTQRSGQVTAELTLVSVDLETRTLVISRNSRCPVLLCENGAWQILDAPAEAVGVRARNTRPVITELALAADQIVVAFTDGIVHAGARRGLSLDPLAATQRLARWPSCSARAVADGLLAEALALDEDRPGDDITVVVACVLSRPETASIEVRRMTVNFPVPPI
jgi:serine phosphatase RsbU (regulator of sigma subunit)